jgi:hypothetical protein
MKLEALLFIAVLNCPYLWEWAGPAYGDVYNPPEFPEWMVDEGMAWLYIMPAGLRYEPLIDPALVLLVIVVETCGNPNYVGAHGEVGLMGIIPRSWTLPDLRSDSVNVQQGSHMLAVLLEQNDWDERETLALYNCGKDKLEQDACGNGGYEYADVALPGLSLFQRRLEAMAGLRSGFILGPWLCTRGYGSEQSCGYRLSRTDSLEFEL